MKVLQCRLFSLLLAVALLIPLNEAMAQGRGDDDAGGLSESRFAGSRVFWEAPMSQG